jgi:hypothetical protein
VVWPHLAKATKSGLLFSGGFAAFIFACQVYITMLCKQEASPKKSRPLTFLDREEESLLI